MVDSDFNGEITSHTFYDRIYLTTKFEWLDI